MQDKDPLGRFIWRHPPNMDAWWEARVAERALRELQPGQKMSDGTIYLGQYTPVDRDGNSLSKTFNVFAAPEDLPEMMTYVGTVARIARLRDWHGHDGTPYEDDTQIYAALRDGSYTGGWIIPTIDILYGKDVDGRGAMSDNILAHKNKGSFKSTFKTAASGDPVHPGWYWSSTERRENAVTVWVVRLSDGTGVWNHRDGNRLSCRPVRLVPA